MYSFLLTIGFFLLVISDLRAQTPSLHSLLDTIIFYQDDPKLKSHWLSLADSMIETKSKEYQDTSIYWFYKRVGAFEFDSKDYKSSISFYQKAIQYYPEDLEPSNKLAHCDILNHLGISYTLTNQKRKGIDYFKKCIHCEMAILAKPKLSTLSKYRNLARACIYAGAYEEAFHYCKKVLYLLNELDPSNVKQAFRTNLLAARAIMHLPYPDSALSYLETADHILGKQAEDFTINDKVYLYKALLRSYHLHKDTVAVKSVFRKYYRTNLKRLGATSDISAVIDHHFICGLYQYRYFDLEKANLHLDSLLHFQCRTNKVNEIIISAIRRPADIITHIQLVIRVNYALWDKTKDTNYLEKALNTAYLGFDVLNYYRRTLNDDINRLEYVEFEYELYDECFELFYEAQKIDLISAEEFWEFSERARAIHINEQINLRGLKRSYHGLDTQLIIKESQLKDSILRLTEALKLKEYESTAYNNIAIQITSLKLHLYKLQDDIASRHPEYRQVRTLRKIPAIRSVQDALQKDEVLVEYIMTESTLKEIDLLFIIVIAKDRIEFIKKERDSLPQQLIEYYQLIQRSPLSYSTKDSMYSAFKVIDSMGRVLRQILLPISIIQDYDHLIIIPHKDLYYQSFASLPYHTGEVNNEVDWNKYSFLGEQKTIQLAFSAEWWMNEKPLNNASDRNMLFVRGSSSKVGAHDLQLSEHGHSFDLVEKKQSLIDQLQNHSYKLVYFAAHAKYDNKTNNAYLHIEKGNPFTFYDLLDLELEGSKIVLAACETQLGDAHRAEGLMGFAYNFAWAGAKGIMATLWKVPDRQSGQIMGHSLNDHRFLSGQLSNAQQDYLKTANGIERHPYYWAGIICYEVHPSSDSSIFFLGVLMLAILIGGLIWGKKIVAR
jgi:hypothetical protein